MPDLSLSLDVSSSAFVSGFDSDAAAGIAAVLAAGGSLTGAQQAACNTFVVGLKAQSLWTKFAGLYLFVGGTSGAHAVNWALPGTYTITWVNSPTQDANGVTGNGTTAYGTTGALASTVCPIDNGHVSAYVRTASPTVDGRFIGATSLTGGASRTELFYDVSTTWACYGPHNNVFNAQAESAGFMVSSRTASNVRHIRANALTASDASASVIGTTQNLAILGSNWEGSGVIQLSNANLAFASFGTGLTTTESGNFRSLVQSLQTAFSRNV